MTELFKEITNQCKLRWPDDRPIDDDKGFWKIAYVKPRNEKALARDCEEQQIGYCLPLYVKRVRRRDNNKPRKSTLPIFSGYFPFVNRDDNQQKLIDTNRVVNFISILDQEKFVFDLNQIIEAVSTDLPILGVKPIEIGKRVEILDGPLMGMTGIVDTIQNQECVSLSVDEFKMAVCIKIDSELLKIID
jgi:transcription antitermination factor NusG